MKYTQGEEFGIHTDAPYRGEDGSVTKLSLVLYLNDDYFGGETWFPDLSLNVKPQTGKVILFAPDLRHRVEKHSHRGEVHCAEQSPVSVVLRTEVAQVGEEGVGVDTAGRGSIVHEVVRWSDISLAGRCSKLENG